MRITSIEDRMDDNLSHQNGSGQGGVGNQLGGVTGQQIGGPNNQTVIKTEDNNTSAPNAPQYTIPGILHFIQHEWSRFEIERSQWDVDRAELQVTFFFFIKTKKIIYFFF